MHAFSNTKCCVRAPAGFTWIRQRGEDLVEQVKLMRAFLNTKCCVCVPLQVSPGYAEEVKTWLGGWGMDGLLASRGFVLNGVTNGIDTE
jgi:glycogen synthase